VGEAQAQAAAKALRSAGITRIISSDLARAARTAQIIAECLGLPIQVDRRWREIDVGRWQGLNRDEIIAWDGEYYQQRERLPLLERGFPDGETYQQHTQRVKGALEELPPLAPGEHILVATHGGSIRAALYGFIDSHLNEVVSNATLTRLQHRHPENQWTLVGHNEAAESVTW
jgi:broad specificity phosphatase PhoE